MRNKTVLVMALMLIATGARAEDSARSPARVSIRESAHSSFRLDGEFRTEAGVSAVREVLTAYDQMPSFVSSVVSSRTPERLESGRIVEQVMRGRFGPFRKTIYLLLHVTEAPTRIEFKDLSARSFKTYAGSWDISRADGRTVVRYALEARPAFYLPGFLSQSAFKKSVEQLLGQVHNEIERRHQRERTTLSR